MIRLQLIVMFSLVSVIIAYQSPSTTPTINGPPDDLLEDLRKIAEKITGDPDNLDKLTQQLKEISVNNQNLAKLIESQMVTSKPIAIDSGKLTPESTQSGSNPLTSIQNPFNNVLDSMSQLFTRMRKVFEQVPVPANSNINPLKALQALESQFQSLMNGFRINNPLLGGGSDKTDQKVETSTPSSSN